MSLKSQASTISEEGKTEPTGLNELLKGIEEKEGNQNEPKCLRPPPKIKIGQIMIGHLDSLRSTSSALPKIQSLESSNPSRKLNTL